MKLGTFIACAGAMARWGTVLENPTLNTGREAASAGTGVCTLHAHAPGGGALPKKWPRKQYPDAHFARRTASFACPEYRRRGCGGEMAEVERGTKVARAGVRRSQTTAERTTTSAAWLPMLPHRHTGDNPQHSHACGRPPAQPTATHRARHRRRRRLGRRRRRLGRRRLGRPHRHLGRRLRPCHLHTRTQASGGEWFGVSLGRPRTHLLERPDRGRAGWRSGAVAARSQRAPTETKGPTPRPCLCCGHHHRRSRRPCDRDH